MTTTAHLVPVPASTPALPVDAWSTYEWPTWVPAAVRIGVEHYFPTGPQDWASYAQLRSAPALGAIVDAYDGAGRVTRGQYVHYAPSNTGRLIHPDGSTSVTYLLGPGRIADMGRPLR